MLRRAVGMHVLVIEDDDGTRRFVETVLRLEGAEVTLASNGRVGLGCLKTAEFDLVLLDLVLPDVSGWEILAYLRDSSSTVPVVVFTVDDDPATLQRAQAMGASGLVTKPVGANELIIELSRYFRS